MTEEVCDRKIQREVEGNVPPIGSVPPNQLQVFLKFKVSQMAPPYAEIYMHNGGAINAMCSDWETDIAVTGSQFSTVVSLLPGGVKEVSVELPEFELMQNGKLCIASSTRFNVMTQRVGTAINGTLVTTVACEGKYFLYHLLLEKDHCQIPMTYKSFMAHAATLCVSNVRMVSFDANGLEKLHTPVFKKDSEQHTQTMETADTLIKKYVDVASDIRQKVVYKPSPMLTKSVFVDNAAACGYSLLHEIVDRSSHLSLETINQLFKAAISVECGHESADVNTFLSHTSQPGIGAAMHTKAVANATSLVVNMLMSYRADGRNVVLPTGLDFSCVESWNRAAPRSSIESNDCDGLALLAIALIRSCIAADEESLNLRPYVRAVRNAIHPHYQVGLSVIGASAAEASSADASHCTVAGHAIVLLIPTMSFLRALSRTMDVPIGKGGNPTAPQDNRDVIDNARFAALFPRKVVDTLPSSERDDLMNWTLAKSAFHSLEALAIEGTTPTTSTLYLKDPQRRIDAYRSSKKDKEAAAKTSPNVMSFVQSLHVGGGQSGSEHAFYADFVELTMASDFPLYTDPLLRALCAAAVQFVFTEDIRGDAVTNAGCAPQNLVTESYGIFPLAQVNTNVGAVLDHAAVASSRDSMPHRKETATLLNEYQSASLKKSIEHVKEFEKFLMSKNVATDDHHFVAYICAYNTLVHNPEAIQQFFNSAKTAATGGHVSLREVKGLAEDANGDQAGFFLHIELFVPV